MSLSVLSFTVLLIASPLIVGSDDLENAYQSLKQAESKKDAAQVKKLAAETCALTRKVTSAPAPESDSEKEAWKNHVNYARDIEMYTEYALHATALQSPPAAKVELLAALEQQNPKSKYLDDAYAPYLLALQQTGAAAKVSAVAEKALVQFPENEDLLLVLADASQSAKQTARAGGYAERLIAVLNKHPKPETMSAADWQRKRSAALGRGYWIAGMAHMERTQYVEADKDLRSALPLVTGNDSMTGPALFSLSLANYELGRATLNKARVLEAAKLSEQAAAIKGPYSQQAWHNAQVMKNEAAKIR